MKRQQTGPSFYNGNPYSWKDGHYIEMSLRTTNHRFHYNDVIMGTIASQITSLTIVYSTVYSVADQRKHQSSASLAFVWGIHRGTGNSPHKWTVTRKMFPFDDVIMLCRPSKTGVGLTFTNLDLFTPGTFNFTHHQLQRLTVNGMKAKYTKHSTWITFHFAYNRFHICYNSHSTSYGDLHANRGPVISSFLYVWQAMGNKSNNKSKVVCCHTINII